MNSRTVTGQYIGGSMLCIECANKYYASHKLYTQPSTLFAGDEVDQQRYCEHCQELIECSVIGDIDNE